MLLQTKRLTLCSIDAQHAPFILQLLNSPSFIHNIRNEGVCSLEQAEMHIQNRYIKSYLAHGFGMYLISLTNTGEAIGICGLVKRDALDCPDIGYALLPDYEGNGYASEAAIGVINYGNTTLGIPQIVGITSLSNKASIKVLEKAGLVFAKTIQMEDGEKMLFLPHL